MGLTSSLRRALALIAALLPLAAPAHGQPEISLNCERLARVDSLPGSSSSCWGYTDPGTGTEYAIIGKEFGTGFYSLADPRHPVLVKFIPGPSSGWREMKTYRQWCYIVSEGGGAGSGFTRSCCSPQIGSRARMASSALSVSCRTLIVPG